MKKTTWIGVVATAMALASMIPQLAALEGTALHRTCRDLCRTGTQWRNGTRLHADIHEVYVGIRQDLKVPSLDRVTG